MGISLKTSFCKLGCSSLMRSFSLFVNVGVGSICYHPAEQSMKHKVYDATNKTMAVNLNLEDHLNLHFFITNSLDRYSYHC